MNQSTDIMQQLNDFVASLTPTQWIIAIVVAVMLAKKLIKLAIVIGLIVFVAFPYVKSSGLIDLENFDANSIIRQILNQLGL
ncbi:MAG: hypothetical protein RL355_135 [Actinomycetota bacterium]|jgi:hypothetical protein